MRSPRASAPAAAMAELYGKATGCCGGKGGSMHLGDPEVGMLPAIAIVGGGNTVVTGLGLAMKLRRTDQVAVCFFGEGATNEGAFHEGLNFAAVEQLPDRARLREQPLRRFDAVTRGSRSCPTWPSAPRPTACRRRSSTGWTSSRCAKPRQARSRRRALARGPDVARVQDVPLHRPQPQRRPRLPHTRGGGRVGGARPASRPRREAVASPSVDQAEDDVRRRARRRGRVRADLSVPRPRRRPRGRLCLRRDRG